MNRVLQLLACSCAALLAQPASGAMEQCLEATCRVTAQDNGRGTGCVFERSNGMVYVLTAAHVATGQAMKCEFWGDGHQSAPLPGETILRVLNDTTDAAVIAVPESEFGGRFPKVIPMAPRGYAIQAGQPLTSVGCAGGAWATGWKGHVLGYDGTDVRFVPAPAQGRSGAALFDESGERIVGIIRARTLDNEQGIATGVQALYSQLCRAAAERQVQQCPPGGCPVPGKQYVLPYRRQQQQQSPNLNPWPTLPSPSPAVSVDLGPTNERLDRIAGMLLQAVTSAPPPMQAPSGPDPLAAQAISAVQELKAAVPGMVEEKIKPLAEKVETVAGAVGPLIRLREKLEADAEEGGLKGKLAQRILDKVDGGEGVDSRLEGKWAKWLVLLGLVVALVYWHKNKHGPVAGLMERMGRPELAEREEAIVERIHNRLRGAVGAVAGAPFGPVGMVAGAAAPLAVDALRDLRGEIKDFIEARLAPAPGQATVTKTAGTSGA